MEVNELAMLTRNLYEHLHLKKKTVLTNDEYRICSALLSGNIDLSHLSKGLYIIKQNIEIFGSLRVSGGNKKINFMQNGKE